MIELSDVSVAFPGVKALRKVSLTVRPCEHLALIGPSGAGKSTLISVLNGRLGVASGTVRVLGSDLESLRSRDLRALRRRIGTVHQSFDLIDPLRVIHNVNAGHLGRWSTARALASLIRPAQREVAIDALNRLGVGDLIDARTDELSGGQRQRVAIARVLVQAPDLILADEPVSSLDPEIGRAALTTLIEDAKQGSRTVVVSLHDIAAARDMFPRLVGVRDGRIVFDRPKSDVSAEDIADLYQVEERGSTEPQTS